MESLRERNRHQLATEYKSQLEKGTITMAEIQEMITQLQTALEKARKTNRRVLVEGQEHMSTLSDMELEDQISALRRIL